MPKVLFLFCFVFLFFETIMTPCSSAGRHLFGAADEMMKGIHVLSERTDRSNGTFLGYQSAVTAEDDLVRLNELLVQKNKQKKSKRTEERRDGGPMKDLMEDQRRFALIERPCLLVCYVQIEIREGRGDASNKLFIQIGRLLPCST